MSVEPALARSPQSGEALKHGMRRHQGAGVRRRGQGDSAKTGAGRGNEEAARVHVVT